MGKQGYLIVLKPEVVLRKYEESELIKKYQKEYRQLRKAFAQFNPNLYRGISRDPLNRYPSLDGTVIQAFRETGIDMNINCKDRIEMYKILKNKIESDNLYSDEDEDLFEIKKDAIHAYNLLDKPEDYEFIGVRRLDFAEDSEVLGFDIGYWGGDHFSLIADTIVTPTWHTPPEKSYAEVVKKLSFLNDNLLFNSPEEAKDFKKYYKSKEWAETEGYEGEFCIIQIEKVLTNQSSGLFPLQETAQKAADFLVILNRINKIINHEIH